MEVIEGKEMNAENWGFSTFNLQNSRMVFFVNRVSLVIDILYHDINYKEAS